MHADVTTMIDDLEQNNPKRPPQFVVTVTGPPLSEIGLDGGLVLYPDGHTEELIGFIFRNYDNRLSVLKNIRIAFAEQYPDCKLVFVS